MLSLDRALGPRVRLLDPRTPEALSARPFLDAASIPLAELPARTHELSPRVEPVSVVVVDESGEAAMEWLRSHGRLAVPVTRPDEGTTLRGRLWEPNRFLQACLPQLSPGRALDLGCGSGRDAVALAALGWTVTAVDRLPDALDKGRDLAGRVLGDEACRIEWLLADLASVSSQADLVLSFFAYDERQIGRLADRLTPGGSLLIETFSRTHAERVGKPGPERTADGPSLAALFPTLEVVVCEEVEGLDRHTVQFWAKRR